MLVKQVAKRLGMSTSQVTNLIRNETLPATKVPNPFIRHGYHYEISDEDLEKFNKTHKTKGFPRGQKRTGERGTKVKESVNAKTSKKKKNNSETVPKSNKGRKTKKQTKV